MKSCYVVSTSSLRDISKEIALYLWQHESMNTDRFLLPDGEYRVQGRVHCHAVRKLAGWDKRVVVKLRPDEGLGYTVIMDSPAWKDKVAVLAASLFGFWPLSVMALWGLADQILLFFRLQRMLKTIQ